MGRADSAVAAVRIGARRIVARVVSQCTGAHTVVGTVEPAKKEHNYFSQF